MFDSFGQLGRMLVGCVETAQQAGLPQILGHMVSLGTNLVNHVHRVQGAALQVQQPVFPVPWGSGVPAELQHQRVHASSAVRVQGAQLWDIMSEYMPTLPCKYIL